MITWWEKTVEYVFVMRHLGGVIAPLDGKHEGIGDATFVRDGRFLLIEFKKSEAEVPSIDKDLEKKIFGPNGACDEHHIVVYGIESDPQLGLAGKTFFSSKRVEVTQWETVSSKGIGHSDFQSYKSSFLAYRNQLRRKRGEEGEFTSQQYDAVVFVSLDRGASFACMTLAQWIQFELEALFRSQLPAPTAPTAPTEPTEPTEPTAPAWAQLSSLDEDRKRAVEGAKHASPSLKNSGPSM